MQQRNHQISQDDEVQFISEDQYFSENESDFQISLQEQQESPSHRICFKQLKTQELADQYSITAVESSQIEINGNNTSLNYQIINKKLEILFNKIKIEEQIDEESSIYQKVQIIYFITQEEMKGYFKFIFKLIDMAKLNNNIQFAQDYIFNSYYSAWNRIKLKRKFQNEYLQ